MAETMLDRRALIGGGLLGAAALIAGPRLLTPEPLGAQPAALPSPRVAALPKPAAAAALPVKEVRLALRCTHTGARCDALLMRGDRIDRQGLAELNHAMRDWRTGDVGDMDPELFRLLANLRDKLDADARKPFDLISGYRSPRTNAMLGERSHGVASKSQHVLGKAADIALPGVETVRIKRAALALRAGGVGHYPQDGFVHVDTGRVRHWGA